MRKWGPMKRRPVRYADAGVSIARAQRAKKRIRELARRTFTRGVVAGIGSFGAMFALERNRYREPVLVASADGVGTKLKIASLARIHTTVGADLVNHCVNDITVQGARPLFFMDYFAAGRLDRRVVADVIVGISRACRAVGCALVGGETAEMPGVYAGGDYDLAGFIVGIVERRKILDGSAVRPGDILLGLPSTGLHTNGYSLARKLLFDVARLRVSSYVKELGTTVGRELLKPHRCYWSLLAPLVERGSLRALAHITGGGLTDNLPRVLPKNCRAVIELASWPVLPIFRYLEKLGKVPRDEMLRTFNLGIGMVAIVSPRELALVEAYFRRRRERGYRIGWIERGRRGVVYRGQSR